ncbi:uncharacterized protein LOC131630496 [Vicia villosa]|uniref:uncharacterized protein LOC131630496 n=1 Tax=Vicia villosa TaxID=3911 RepID=UPI00273C45BC|nr:uncharacterized protein LOC131630496 [Vicia villosa]
MNLVSLNIRGSGNRAKRQEIRKLLEQEKIDLCLIQETKQSHISEEYVHSIWGRSFHGTGYVGIQITWQNLLLYIVCIYSSCFLEEKRHLWAEILRRKSSFSEGLWCLGGDFNAVKKTNEMKGRTGSGNLSEMAEFGAFIEEMELIDLPATGRKFTWFNAAGSSMSRLDRFLLSEGLIGAWDLKVQKVGDRSFSDHCPVFLKANNRNWGPIPFKFFNPWLKHEELIPFVDSVWNSLNIS